MICCRRGRELECMTTAGLKCSERSREGYWEFAEPSPRNVPGGDTADGGALFFVRKLTARSCI